VLEENRKKREKREKGGRKEIRGKRRGLKSQEGKAWVADKCVLASSRQ
jgi:hypothetical protein